MEAIGKACHKIALPLRKAWPLRPRLSIHRAAESQPI
jgi:hypothetical protein